MLGKHGMSSIKYSDLPPKLKNANTLKTKLAILTVEQQHAIEREGAKGNDATTQIHFTCG